MSKELENMTQQELILKVKQLESTNQQLETGVQHLESQAQHLESEKQHLESEKQHLQFRIDCKSSNQSEIIYHKAKLYF